jgi:hypothetical protein
VEGWDGYSFEDYRATLHQHFDHGGDETIVMSESPMRHLHDRLKKRSKLNSSTFVVIEKIFLVKMDFVRGCAHQVERGPWIDIRTFLIVSEILE